MKVCSGCKYKLIKFEDSLKNDDSFEFICKNEESVLGGMYGKCLKGNTETFINFYKTYGDKPKSEYEDLLIECYEDSDFVKGLDKCISIADNLLKDIKSK